MSAVGSEEEAIEKLKGKVQPGDAIWGVDVSWVHSETTDAKEKEEGRTVIRKYLKASEGVVDTAVTRILDTIKWRKEFVTEALLNRTFNDSFKDAGYVHKTDKQGRPVMYNIYGVHQDIFSDLQEFLKWRVQLMEKGVALLDLPNVDSMVQIHDYDGVSMFSSNEQTKAAAKETVKLFGDHYPELLSKKFFINVPWYMSGFYAFLKPFISSRTAEKFVICSSGYKEDMLNVISIENIPVKYGGLSITGNEIVAGENAAPAASSASDATPNPRFVLPFLPPKEIEAMPAVQVDVASGKFHTVEFKVEQAPATLVWEFALFDNDIEFACTFVDDEGKLTNVQEVKKFGSNLNLGRAEFQTPGMVKLIWDNNYSFFTSKKVYYRYLLTYPQKQ